jgi:hypothetical protein
MSDTDHSSPIDEQERERLNRHLADHARSVNLSSTLSSTIVRRAERRTTRRRSISLIGAAALVVGGIAGSAIVVRDGNRRGGGVVPANSVRTAPEATASEPSTSVRSITPQAPTTSAESVAEPAPLSWEAADLGTDSLVANLYQTFTGNGPLYAWTTDEQASADFISSLYRSDDAVSWEPIATAPDLAVIAAAAVSTHIALLGYAPSADATDANDVVVKVSNDDGVTWQTIPLPLQIPAAQPGGIQVRPTPASVVFSGETIVAAIGLYVVPDPGVLQTSAAASDDPAAIAPRLYISAGGQPFEAVANSPTVEAPSSRSVALAASDSGFLALFAGPTANAADTPRSTFWQSDDGRTWTVLGALPVQDPYVATIGRVDSTYAVATPDFLWLSTDGATWQSSNLSGLLDSDGQSGQLLPYAARIEPTGITLVGILPITHQDVSITKAGVTETFHGGSLSDISFYDEATGDELGRVTTTPFDNGVVRALGDGKIDILDTNGNIRATFTIEEFAQASNAATSEPPTGGSPAQGVILYSHDGFTWSSTSINDLTGGQPSDVAWINHIGGATAIGIWVEAGDNPAPSRHLYVLTATAPP